MADDNPTKKATLFLSLYQSIKDSPVRTLNFFCLVANTYNSFFPLFFKCSLINQKRSLITHLDAIEIHRVTNKPTRAVTIFLFTDKILIASRPSIEAKGFDIKDLLTSSTHQPQQKISNNHTKRRDYFLKFKGWADIESIEIFDGPSGK